MLWLSLLCCFCLVFSFLDLNFVVGWLFLLVFCFFFFLFFLLLKLSIELMKFFVLSFLLLCVFCWCGILYGKKSSWVWCIVVVILVLLIYLFV